MGRLTKRFANGVAYTTEPIWRHAGVITTIGGEAIDKLAAYEDAEEQGLLLRLPCKIGTEVWKIINLRDNFTDIPYKIVAIVNFRLDMLKEIGKTVFLTKEEAEMKLAELTENRNCSNEDSPEQALTERNGV